MNRHIARIGACTAFAIAAPVSAQTAPPADKTYVSAAEIATMIAKAEADPRAATTVIVQRLPGRGRYHPDLHRRTVPAPPDLHEKEAEFFFVVRGGGTLTTGGHIVRPAATPGQPAPAAVIAGGTERKVAKGDMFVVPENTPHQFTTIDRELVLMSLHVPMAAEVPQTQP